MSREEQVDHIIHDFGGKVENFPSSLSLEEQGLFVLGYHHQRYELYRRRSPETATSSQETLTETTGA
jgi:hypothetical protein